MPAYWVTALVLCLIIMYFFHFHETICAVKCWLTEHHTFNTKSAMHILEKEV
jgi:hypothetical protein